jgi:hypothetical protein
MIDDLGDLGGLEDLPDMGDLLDVADGAGLADDAAGVEILDGLEIPDPFGEETLTDIGEFDWLGDNELYVHEWDPQHFDGIGDPIGLADLWFIQEGDNACAVATQTMVLEAITGAGFDEEALADLAEANGWFDPEIGTPLGAVGLLLEHHGLDTEVLFGAEIGDLAAALERGDHVLVSVNANEIWTPLRDAYGMPVQQPVDGHSVWVTGLDRSPDGTFHVLLNDPGTPDGQMAPVALEDFVNAWQDVDNHLVIAREAGGVV